MIASEMTKEIQKLITSTHQQYTNADTTDTRAKAFYALKKVTLDEILFLWKAMTASRGEFNNALTKLEAKVSSEIVESFGGEQQAYEEVSQLITSAKTSSPA